MTIDLDHLILGFDSPLASLAQVGGKGANLARLSQAGFRVPPGFCITTDAYTLILDEGDLCPFIDQRIFFLRPDDLPALESASAEIRSRFAAQPVPAELADTICHAYYKLGAPPVAVRSSATAEDLPGFSFAGQQDTFLNVVGETALLAAIMQCWSSLWTARAIGYRTRNSIDHHAASLAVVVQEMVPAETSGVLFTADPLTGLRHHAVIDATFGLGEALVSGQVEPDHYVVDPHAGIIHSRTLGSKAVAVQSRPGGGVQMTALNAAVMQALSDDQILTLAREGQKIEALYGVPQDIEWAWDGGGLKILQARPITTLYPLPEGMPAEPLEVMFSLGAVQGMLDPITPLGQETIQLVLIGFGRLAGYEFTLQNHRMLAVAGERLWGRITGFMRNEMGRKFAAIVFASVDPPTIQALRSIFAESSLQPRRRGLSLSTLGHILQLAVPIGLNVVLNIARPDARREAITAWTEKILAQELQLARRTGQSPAENLSLALERMEAISPLITKMAPVFISGIAASMAMLTLLNKLSRSAGHSAAQGGFTPLTLEMVRGIPHNVTVEMDLALWRSAGVIAADPDAKCQFDLQKPSDLAYAYRRRALPGAALAALDSFMERYRLRGLAEIDLGRPRWVDDPTPVMQAVQSYLKIPAAQAPDRIFAAGEVAAAAAVEQLAGQVSAARGGWLKARLVRFAARRVRALMGLRESPKFAIVRLFGSVRSALLVVGKQLKDQGILEQPEDIFYLSNVELHALTRQEDRPWKAMVTERRAVYNREKLRRQVPRLLLSDGRAFYDGLAPSSPDSGQMTGMPVSPGLAEGKVRVVLDPHTAQLLPGEILVCPGTDPSWTPLFLAAGGLVMEVGGMMTHGAVVAREYGIPAIVGVHQATTRLVTGQRIRIDGASGRIDLLDQPPSA